MPTAPLSKFNLGRPEDLGETSVRGLGARALVVGLVREVRRVYRTRSTGRPEAARRLAQRASVGDPPEVALGISAAKGPWPLTQAADDGEGVVSDNNFLLANLVE